MMLQAWAPHLEWHYKVCGQCPPLVRTQVGTAIWETSLVFPLEPKIRTSLWLRNPTCNIHQGHWNKDPGELSPLQVPSTIHKAKHGSNLSVQSSLSKETVYIDSLEFYSAPQEGKPTICDHVDRPGGHHGGWNKTYPDESLCAVTERNLKWQNLW